MLILGETQLKPVMLSFPCENLLDVISLIWS